ncbi:MAG: hypothetical protein HC888_02880 [Candidatus Competibacteraceae bacterium]|nr:hypothetical protein [Candidatus Competibacteraceae bacterium]
MKLDWADTPNASTYDVYLKVDSGSFSKVGANLTVSEWTPSQTYLAASFSWYVVAKNNAGTTTGPTWTFTIQVSELVGIITVPDPPGAGNQPKTFTIRIKKFGSGNIDPAVRTWIIIHGRNDWTINNGWASSLADAIHSNGNLTQNDQILFLDWRDAAYSSIEPVDFNTAGPAFARERANA